MNTVYLALEEHDAIKKFNDEILDIPNRTFHKKRT